MLRGQVRDGHDPFSERRTVKAAASAAAAEAKAAAVTASYTVDRPISDWTAHHLTERSGSYRTYEPRRLRSVLREWLDLAAASLRSEDAVRVLDKVKADRGPIAANRVHAAARACWGWAVRRRALGANPWKDLPRPSRENQRERVLSDAEIAALWSGAASLGEPFGGIVRILLLTGQRRSEVAGMRWDELDLEAGIWRLSGARTKNGRSHIVPLAAAALELLRKVPRHANALLVFEGVRGTVPSGFSKIKLRLDNALAAAAEQTGRACEPWVLHDLRRTMATGLQRLGVRLEVTEALLNHVSGSRSGIVGVYQRHEWAREKEAAAEAWAAHLMQCVEGASEAGNVVPFDRPRPAEAG